MDTGQSPLEAPPGRPPAAGRFGPEWLRRANTTLILILLLAGMGFAFRALSKRAAEDLPVPGVSVKVRTERGAGVEARAAPPPDRRAAGPPITMEVTLADVASLVRLIEETARIRVALPCPAAQRVSLRVRGAPVEAALAAVAAAANLTLTGRDGTFILNACAPPSREARGTRTED